MFKISKAFYLADFASKSIMEIDNEIQAVKNKHIPYNTLPKQKRKKKI